ncbi:class I SAM-dependent methyltransferase [Rhodovibrionaceae bacterium A322]
MSDALDAFLKHQEEGDRLLQELLASNPSEEDYLKITRAWHHSHQLFKEQAFDPKESKNLEAFEKGWAAQSVQFAIDLTRFLHQVMQKHYRRADTLKLLDVGAGTAAGTELFAKLHSGRHVYSLLEVDAVDVVPHRLKWARLMYPNIDYRVSDLFALPDNAWDFVVCSHVIEHVPEPEVFLKKLTEICRGFCFVYAPYNEIDRIPGHINTITEDLFDGYTLEALEIFNSMGWKADRPDCQCIMAVLDCRSPDPA